MGLQVSSPIRRYRAWQARANNTSYFAETDGIVHAWDATTIIDIKGFTDNVDPPVTQRAYGGFNDVSGGGDGITMCVRKGDYWKVTGAVTVWWLPEQ